MPRQGDGSSDNGPFDTSHHIIHGVDTSKDMNRKHKAAPLPEGISEKGAGKKANERGEQALRDADVKNVEKVGEEKKEEKKIRVHV